MPHPLHAYLRMHALTFGDFTLASGAKSPYYVDVRRVSFLGEGAQLVADGILDLLASERVGFDAIGGMDMGATPIAAAVAMRSFQRGAPVPTFVVRKEAKAHGAKRPVEGNLPESPSRLVIVDDVVTSAGSIIKAIDVVQALGHGVVLAVAVLDRLAGGAERLENLNIPYRALATIRDLGVEPIPATA